MTAKVRTAGEDKSNPFAQTDANICDNRPIAWLGVMKDSL